MSAVLLLAPAVSMVPALVSATPVVVDRFQDGSTGARLNFSERSWNDTLAIELPRGAQISGAELSVTGIEGSSIVDAKMDFDTDPVGDDLWALWNNTSDVYPPKVDPYKSGWPPAKDADIDNIAADDGKYWLVQAMVEGSVNTQSYPYQLYHFHPEGLPATSYTVSWNGYGQCTINTTAVYQATLWLYNHTGASWERRASYGSNASDDVWLEASFLPTDDFVSANGSVDALVVGPHSLVIIQPPIIQRAPGNLYTDYIALEIGVPGKLEYPQNATLRLGGAQLNLSVGPLGGRVDVGDALGLKDAMQAAVDAEVVMPGTIVIPLNFSVQWRTLSGLDVGGLSITYEPAVNAPPVWRGPSAVEVEEDSQWTGALDLGTAFSDDWNQEQLRYSIVNVSDPANLSTRMQFGISGNWTLMVRPAPDFFGEVRVTFNATDMFGEVTESPALVVRITQLSDRPVIVDPGELHASECVRFQFTMRARDPDMPDDVLTWSDGSDLLDVNATSGVIDWTPGKDQIGTHRVPVTVTDRFGLQGIATFTIIVANTNDPPVITSTLTLAVDQDQAVEYDIAATDPDTPFGDVLTFYAFSEDIEVLCDMATGKVTFTPTNDNIGALSILLRVQDRAGFKDDRTLAVTVRNVNDPPVLQGPGPQLHDQGETVSVRLVATDPDLSVAGAGEHITLTHDGPAWLGPDPAGWINLIVGQANVGVWWVNYTLTDAAGLVSQVQVVWTLIDVNDAPVISTVVPTVVNGREGERFVLALQATDLDGNLLVWSDDSPLFTIGSTNGTISFMPIQSDVGTHRVTVTASDGHGGEATVTFDLVVANVNDPPVVGNVAPLSGTSYKEGEAISFLASATDKDGDRLTYIWKEGSRELGRGSPFTTNGLKPGRHTITLVVDDGNATAERQLEVVVKEKEGGIGPVVIALGAVVAVAVVIVVVVLAMRARKGTPTGEEETASLAGSPGPAGGVGAKAPETEEPLKIEIEHREV